jgi:hypothetical protein
MSLPHTPLGSPLFRQAGLYGWPFGLCLAQNMPNALLPAILANNSAMEKPGHGSKRVTVFMAASFQLAGCQQQAKHLEKIEN